MEILLDSAEKNSTFNITPMFPVNICLTEGYKEAMNDIQNGRVYHADNVDDMFQQILGYIPK